jgi:hypothetical protein
MTTDRINATDKVEAACSYNTKPADQMSIQGSYHAVCYDAQGNVKWEDDIKNLVTTVGKNLTLDTILGNSAAGAGSGSSQRPHILWQPQDSNIWLRRCWREGHIFGLHLLDHIDRHGGGLLHQHRRQRNG